MLSKGSKQKLQTPRAFDIKKAKNGGTVVTHHMDKGPGYDYQEPEVHAFGPNDKAKVLKHMKDVLGLNPKAEQEDLGAFGR